MHDAFISIPNPQIGLVEMLRQRHAYSQRITCGELWMGWRPCAYLPLPYTPLPCANSFPSNPE